MDYLSQTNIQEGDSSSYSTVTTQTEGQGTVHTHIQSTVNGVTKTLDSDKPGTYTVENSGNPTHMTTPITQQTLTQAAHSQQLPYLLMLMGGLALISFLLYRKIHQKA